MTTKTKNKMKSKSTKEITDTIFIDIFDLFLNGRYTKKNARTSKTTAYKIHPIGGGKNPEHIVIMM